MGWPLFAFQTLHILLEHSDHSGPLFVSLSIMPPPPLGSLCLLYSLLKLCSCISLSYLTPSYPLDFNPVIAFQRSLPWLFWAHPNFFLCSFTAPHIDTSSGVLTTVVIFYLSVLLSHHLPVWSSPLWTHPTHGAIISGTLLAGCFSKTSGPRSLCVYTILSKSLDWLEFGSLLCSRFFLFDVSSFTNKWKWPSSFYTSCWINDL